MEKALSKGSSLEREFHMEPALCKGISLYATPVKDLGPKPNDKLTHHLQTQVTRALAVTSFPEEGSVKEA